MVDVHDKSLRTMKIKYSDVNAQWVAYWCDYYYTAMDEEALHKSWFNWQLVPQEGDDSVDDGFYHKIIDAISGETLANNVIAPTDWADGCQALLALRYFLTNIEEATLFNLV